MSREYEEMQVEKWVNLEDVAAPVRFTGGNFRRETAQAKLERLKNLMNE